MGRLGARFALVVCGAAFLSALGCGASADDSTDSDASIVLGGSSGAGGSTAPGGSGGIGGTGGSIGSGGSAGTGGSTGTGGLTGSAGSSGAGGLSVPADAGPGPDASRNDAASDGPRTTVDAAPPVEANVPDAAPLAPNVVSVVINAGPGAPDVPYVNGLFAAVTVCVPGTSTCQTIDGLLVDSASTGLRIRSSVLTLALPREQDASGNTLAACAQFADGSYMWGPAARADIRMSGERASSVPVQIVADPTSATFVAPPSACSSGGGKNLGELGVFGANGILGVSFFLQDCGSACVTSTSPGLYFRCTASACQATRVALASQMTNPVAMFAADNNGLRIALPAVPAEGAASVTGTLTFGIGTQANNGLGGAAILPGNANGLLTTVFGGRTYVSTTIDSGSNGIFFGGANAATLPLCTKNTSFYCPASTLALSASIAGVRGASATIAFNISNADSLLVGQHFAFPGLAGTASPIDAFSWGIPFFFGRTVFVAFEGKSTPGGAGPYWAY
jgi:hypothetical protein